MHNEYPSQTDKICAEIIVMIMDAAKPPFTANVDKLYGDLCAKFESALNLCEAERFPSEVMKDLLYPLAALADETLMAVPQYRTRWIANPLQLRFFGEMGAGSGFFSRLQKLANNPQGRERLLKQYFICLALGFKGMYGVSGQASNQSNLRMHFENVGAMLTGMQTNALHAMASAGHKGSRNKFFSFRKCLVAAFLLLLVGAGAVYLPALSEFLKFMENFL